MKAILYSLVVLSCLRVRGNTIDFSSFPDLTNVGCLPSEEASHIAEYNKVEIINNLQKYPLADLLSQRGIIPEDNPKFNEFLDCVWKKENYLNENGDVNYLKLEQVVKDAIVKVVGYTGPAINLSMAHALLLVDECRPMGEIKTENRIAKIQNHIVSKLQFFAKI